MSTTLTQTFAKWYKTNMAEAIEDEEHFSCSPHASIKRACYIAMDERSVAGHTAGEKNYQMQIVTAIRDKGEVHGTFHMNLDTRSLEPRPHCL